MSENFNTHHEIVSRLLKYCHQDREAALQVYEQLIAARQQSFQLPDGKVSLTQKQLEELTERFSSEVGSEVWTSKRAKY